MHTEHTPQQLFSIRQVADALGVHTKTVQTLIKLGQLRAVNINTGDGRPTYRIRQADFEHFLASRQVSG